MIIYLFKELQTAMQTTSNKPQTTFKIIYDKREINNFIKMNEV